MSIEYDVIGYSLVPVPTHLFKVVLGVNARNFAKEQVRDSSLRGAGAPLKSQVLSWPESRPPPAIFGAFVMPNKAMPDDQHAERFRVPLSFIELTTGIDFGVSNLRNPSRPCILAISPGIHRHFHALKQV